MIELPEAINLAKQLNQSVVGKRVKSVVANKSPHKFAWYHGDPQEYDRLLSSKTIEKAVSFGGIVEMNAGDVSLRIGDGVGLRYHEISDKRPKKHQLLIEFEDGTAISASIQMYGGIWCFKNGEFDNSYHNIALSKPSPLTNEFNEEYFYSMLSNENLQKLSAKAFLATEQRIPGLGNGVLQDILWKAKIHPKRKMNTLDEMEIKLLFNSIKTILKNMTESGGRDTEKDLFGDYGKYQTVLSKNTIEIPCSVCDGFIKKESYLGGSIYYCPECQKL